MSVLDAKSDKLLATLKTPVHQMSADGQTLYVSVKQGSPRDKEATQPDDVIRIALK